MEHKRRPIPIGAKVRSRFRAPWIGIVTWQHPSTFGDGACVSVRLMLDRHGNPIRKPDKQYNLHTISSGWLEVLELPPGSEHTAFYCWKEHRYEKLV